MDNAVTDTPPSRLFGDERRISLINHSTVLIQTQGEVINHINLHRFVTLIASLAPGDQVRLAGTADRLAETVRQLASAFTLLVLITYLLLAALYLILTGIVVNNTFLLVDRARQRQRDYGEDPDKALYYATCDRMRVIFMTAATSVLGMLPLAVIPGQGAELYQGLEIVLTGGLAFATLLMPTVVSALMGLLYDLSGRRASSLSPPSPLPAEVTPIAPTGGTSGGS